MTEISATNESCQVTEAARIDNVIDDTKKEFAAEVAPDASHKVDTAVSRDHNSVEKSDKLKKGDDCTSKASRKSEKVSRKEQAKACHKDDKNADHVLKTLQNLKTPEERFTALGKKYSEVVEDNRNLQLTLKQSERQTLQLMKEKDQLQTDQSKAILARSRLEGLCRELQKQCKTVKEESLQRIRDEEEKRKEISSKFQATMTEISSLMQEVNQKNQMLRDENVELSQKMKSLLEQYELREQQFDKVTKHKDLELQLSEAKLAKANMLMAEEKEKFLREKQKLLEELTDYQRRCTELVTNEVQLRNQLSVYTDKYTEFQDTLTKSNQVFVSFKGEMEKMSKKIKKLEKETGSWKSRWENSNRALLEMAGDKQRHDADMASSQKKVTQLEKLCRALQGECTSLRNQLKASDLIKGFTEAGSNKAVVKSSPACKDVPVQTCNGDDATPYTSTSLLCCSTFVDRSEVAEVNSDARPSDTANAESVMT